MLILKLVMISKYSNMHLVIAYIYAHTYWNNVTHLSSRIIVNIQIAFFTTSYEITIRRLILPKIYYKIFMTFFCLVIPWQIYIFMSLDFHFQFVDNAFTPNITEQSCYDVPIIWPIFDCISGYNSLLNIYKNVTCNTYDLR